MATQILHDCGTLTKPEWDSPKLQRKHRLTMPELMAIDPHCHRCGCELQDYDSTDAETFALAMRKRRKLACKACRNAICAAESRAKALRWQQYQEELRQAAGSC